jgi:hypothetical protein
MLQQTSELVLSYTGKRWVSQKLRRFFCMRTKDSLYQTVLKNVIFRSSENLLKREIEVLFLTLICS